MQWGGRPCLVWGSAFPEAVTSELRAAGGGGVCRAQRWGTTLKQRKLCAKAPGQEGGFI